MIFLGQWGLNIFMAIFIYYIEMIIQIYAATSRAWVYHVISSFSYSSSTDSLYLIIGLGGTIKVRKSNLPIIRMTYTYWVSTINMAPS